MTSPARRDEDLIMPNNLFCAAQLSSFEMP